MDSGKVIETRVPKNPWLKELARMPRKQNVGVSESLADLMKIEVLF